MLDDAVCTRGVLDSVTVPDEMLIGPDVATTVIWTLPVDRETVSPPEEVTGAIDGVAWVPATWICVRPPEDRMTGLDVDTTTTWIF